MSSLRCNTGQPEGQGQQANQHATQCKRNHMLCFKAILTAWAAVIVRLHSGWASWVQVCPGSSLWVVFAGKMCHKLQEKGQCVSQARMSVVRLSIDFALCRGVECLMFRAIAQQHTNDECNHAEWTLHVGPSATRGVLSNAGLSLCVKSTSSICGSVCYFAIL